MRRSVRRSRRVVPTVSLARCKGPPTVTPTAPPTAPPDSCSIYCPPRIYRTCGSYGRRVGGEGPEGGPITQVRPDVCFRHELRQVADYLEARMRVASSPLARRRCQKVSTARGSYTSRTQATAASGRIPPSTPSTATARPVRPRQPEHATSTRSSTHVHTAIEGSGQRPKGARLVRREPGVRPLDPHDRPLCRRWLLGQQIESDVWVDNVDRSTDPMPPAEYSTPVCEFDHARSGRPPGHLQGPTSRTACRPHHSHRLHWAGHGRRSTAGGMRRYGPPNPDLSVGPD